LTSGSHGDETHVLASGAVACRICQEPIKANAKKCTHCGSYQDWRGQIAVSSTVLALIIALITVLTAAIPVVIDVFTANNSHLVASWQDPYQGEDNYYDMYILISNEGNRPGAVISAGISVLIKEGSTHESGVGGWNSLIMEGGGKPIIIEAGMSKLIHFYDERPPNESRFAVFRDLFESDRATCQLFVTTTNFRGEPFGINIPSSCSSLEEFLVKEFRG
jgi:hypothetical protein